MVSNNAYISYRGDILWLDFDPQACREQPSRWLALVLSDRQYKERSELMLLCPITSQYKSYPFIVALPETLPPKPSHVFSDQLKSFDWTMRNVAFITKALADSVAQVTVFASGIVKGKK